MAASVPLVPNLEVPKGNWIAHNLRLVNEDSRELFPKSQQGSRGGRRDKFHSLYKKDFYDYPTDNYVEGLKEKGTVPKRETIRDVLFGQSPSEVFAEWKVPSRLVPETKPVAREVASARRLATPLKVERQKSLPVCRTSRQEKLLAPPPPGLGPRSYTTIDGTELQTGKDRLRASLQPHTVNAADSWLRQAPPTDRKVIQRVLQMQEKQHQLQHAMRRSLQPDARKHVEDWLNTASDQERQVALKFFTSVAGAKLMGQTEGEQTGRLQAVIKTLNTGEAKGAPVRRSLDSAPTGKRPSLKFVNLLTPEEKQDRWMHTTWHHLPEYKDKNPVSNESSHYTRPHAPTPRHFVIHPDWG